jgi:hypothetical protein
MSIHPQAPRDAVLADSIAPQYSFVLDCSHPSLIISSHVSLMMGIVVRLRLRDNIVPNPYFGLHHLPMCAYSCDTLALTGIQSEPT